MLSQPVVLWLSRTTHTEPFGMAFRTPSLLGKSPKRPVLVAGQIPVFASKRTDHVAPSADARIRLPVKDMYFHARLNGAVSAGLTESVVASTGNAASPAIVVGAPSFKTTVHLSSNEADPVLPE